MSFKLGTDKKSEKSTLDQIVSTSGTQTEQLEIDDEAIKKIADDILSGTGGLADIFGGEQNSGIYNSSVAAQEAGDLTTNLIGEIAKLRAKKINTTDSEQETDAVQRGKSFGFSTEQGVDLGDL